MRPNNANNRRSRGRGGRKSGNTRNQAFDSNGPGARVRGNASQIYEKYQQLARDAASGGDRVGAENFLQHAEHYYRLMIVNGPKPEPRNGAEDSQSDGADGGNTGAEAEVVEASRPAEAAEAAAENVESDADSLPDSLKPSGKGSRSNGRRRRPRKADDADQSDASAAEQTADDEAEASPA